MHLTVIDAGGRYGIHPTWRGYPGALAYTMFEPDVTEAARLADKYGVRPDVTVVPQALGAQPGQLTLNILRHRGQNSAYAPNSESVWFTSRPGQGDVIDTIHAPMTTIDLYCATAGLSVDFMKVDTEGSEMSILEGAEKQLANSVLGVRCEVNFDECYVGMPLFSDILPFFLKRGFFLLNIDYNGQGVHQNAFADGPTYGTLVSSDAVFLRRWAGVAERWRGDDLKVPALKYAAFCFLNGASDVAMQALLDARAAGVDLAASVGGGLQEFVERNVHFLLNRLQYKPGYSTEAMAATFRQLFDKDMMTLHEFYESLSLNPH